MLEAILKGKISSHVEGKEDLLTSVVFGALKRMPPDAGISPLLAKARGFHGERVAQNALAIISAEFEFWPWWHEAGEPYGAEPDVVLWLSLRDGSRAAIAVEVKRDSGIHGDEERNQLYRQMANGSLLCARKGFNFIGLLLVTTHIYFPRDEVEDALTDLKGLGSREVPIWWVSWREVRPLLAYIFELDNHSIHSGLIQEIAECLRKWDLEFYHGITKPLHASMAKFTLPFHWGSHIGKSTWTFRR